MGSKTREIVWLTVSCIDYGTSIREAKMITVSTTDFNNVIRMLRLNKKDQDLYFSIRAALIEETDWVTCYQWAMHIVETDASNKRNQDDNKME